MARTDNVTLVANRSHGLWAGREIQTMGIRTRGYAEGSLCRVKFALFKLQGLSSKRVDKLRSPELVQLFWKPWYTYFHRNWTDNSSDIHVDSFTHYALHRTCRNNNAKRNSGGIIVYIKDYLVNHISLYLQNCDSYMWLKLNGGLFNLANDVYMCISYIIPQNSSRQTTVDCNIFNDILDDICNIQCKN